MEETTVDDTYRVHLPKKLIDLLNIKPRDRFDIHIEAGNKIVLEKAKKDFKRTEEGEDPLIELLESPAHIEPAKMKKLNLNMLEEELWTT